MSPVPDDILAHVSLFRRVSVEDRERLQSVASVRNCDRGDHVFREGDPSDYLLVVLTGRVTVYKHAPDLTEKDGVVLRGRAARDIRGAMAATSAQGRSTQADACVVGTEGEQVRAPHRLYLCTTHDVRNTFPGGPPL